MPPSATPPANIRKAKVLLVDDHSVVREGFKRKIDESRDFSVCGEAADGPQSLELLEKLKPEIAIIDLNLKGMNGIELIKNIRKRYAKIKILVVSMFDESVYAERALRAGANGYVMKEESIDLTMTALRKIVEGKIHLSDKFSEAMLTQAVQGKKSVGLHPIDKLSDRELEVFRLFGQGHKIGLIAKELNLSIKTVESYRAQIKEKLNLKSAAELDQHAIEWSRSEYLA